MCKQYKYQAEIDKFLAENEVNMPFLSNPDEMLAFRYVFSKETEKNNLPAYISKPKRALKIPQVIGYALSCYDDQSGAEANYYRFSETNRNFPKTAGDSLAVSRLSNNEGKVTEVNSTHHYSLFEYKGSDLSKNQAIIKEFQNEEH